MSRVIALVNQKGGVAKTTTAHNLGAGLAKLGKKVLLIDNDPQGSLTISMGYHMPDKLDVTLTNLLAQIINDEDITLKQAILKIEEGVELIPSNVELAGLEVSLVGIMSSETVLKELVDVIKSDYDFIIIDCCPSLGKLTINALAAADEVIVPVQATYLSVKGLEQLLKTVSRVKRKINPVLSIRGILMTMVDVRTTYAREIDKLVRETYGESVPVFKNWIPMAVRVAEAPTEGLSIYQYDAKGKVAAAYEALTKEVASDGEKALF